MSRASKITLGATSLFALSTVLIVHFQQKAERSVSFSHFRPLPSPAKNIG